MTQEQIMNGIKSLASSKGSYGRLYRALQCRDTRVAFFREYPPKKYRDIVDFIMDLEG